MVFENTWGKLFGRKKKESSQSTDTLEQILAMVENPIQKVIASHKASVDVEKDVYEIVANPEKYSNRYMDHGYQALLEELQEGTVPIPKEAVESWVKKCNPRFFEYGINETIKAYLKPESIQEKGMNVYTWLVDEQENDKSNNCLDYFFQKRNKIITSFELPKTKTLDLDKRLFKNAIKFSIAGEVYRLTYCDTKLIDGVPSYSKVRSFQQKLGLVKDEISDIAAEIVKNVLDGKNITQIKYESKKDKAREEIEMAYGMLLEFGDKLALTEGEEKKLAAKYKTTKYVHMKFLQKYFPEEAAQWEKNKEESLQHVLEEAACRRKSEDEASKEKLFGEYFIDSRNKIKGVEPFSSEKFRTYDTQCFKQALKDGNLEFAHQIAVERDYKETQILEKIK